MTLPSQRNLLSRRNLLRGAGVCLALPALPSLSPRGLNAKTAQAKRFILCSFPNGAPTHWWDGVPKFGSTLRGDDFQLPRLLSAFAPLKSKLLMVSHLGNYSWRKDQSDSSLDPAIEPAHSRCMAALTTCVDADQKARDAGIKDVSTAAVNGVSVDQLIVQLAKDQATSKGSLQTGLGVKPGFFDYRSSAYNQAISWKSPQEPLMRSVNPKAVFDALIQAGAATSGASSTTAAASDAAQRAAADKSVLDAVLEDAKALQPRLGKEDRVIVQQYLDSVRSIETEVTRLSGTMTSSAGCSVIATPGVVPEPPGPQQGLTQGDNGYDHEAHADVMNDLIVMALQCDVTRVVTHMLDDARSEFEYRNIPAAVRAQVDLEYREGSSLHYHSCQHAQGNLSRSVKDGRYEVAETSNKDYAAITCWVAGKVAALAGRLDAIADGDGSLLDHSVLVLGSEMRTHDHDGFDLPLLLLGGGGNLLTNAHVAYGELGQDRQVRDLWFTLLKQYYGLDISAFGEDVRGLSNALLEEILA